MYSSASSFRASTSGKFDLKALAVTIVILPGLLLLAPLFSPIKGPLRHRPQVRSWDQLYICLVTKGTNPDTVMRSVSEMRHLQELDSRIRFVVLTEEGCKFDDAELGVQVVYVPKSFVPARAVYKARALEYFRLHKNLLDTKWVLHLDEETGIDEHCIGTCIDFIEREPDFEWGQGLIAYNTVNYWVNPLMTFSEIVRFRDDLGRFQFQHARLHVPFFGCHGSFLLTSGVVENTVTWETDCLAEDFWFACQAWYAGLRGGFIPSLVREQSPWSIMDLLKQRRRWFCGIWTVGFFGKFCATMWLISTFEFPLAVASRFGYLFVPPWLAFLSRIFFSVGLSSLLLATLVHDLDMGVSIWGMIWHLALARVLSVLANLLQSAAIVYAILSPPKGFQVVVKK